MNRIYLDNAASTPLDPEVLNIMIDVLRNYDGNPSSSHNHGRQLKALIEQARKDIANLIGAAPSEIFFTSGGTEADNMAIKGAVEAQAIAQIITTRIEHHAVTHTVEGLECKGMKVVWLPVDAEGFPDMVALEGALKNGPKALVSLMHANNELGTMIDLDAVSKLCAKHGAILHSDTVQTMAHVHYRLCDMPLHFVTASAHKFYGPKGVGFLYVRLGTRIPAFICGGAQERDMRAGTENVAGIVAMAAALKKCYGTFEHKSAHLWSLKERMRDRLMATIPGVKFNGAIERGRSIPTVLNVAFPGLEMEPFILENLDINGVSASGGSACTSGSVKGSHVLAGIGCSPIQTANSVRFSFGVQNTFEEIDMAVEKMGLFFSVRA